MSEIVTLARPYAEAAYQAAIDKGTLPNWQAALSRLAAFVADPTMAACLLDPALAAEQKAELLYTLFTGTDKVNDDFSKEISRLLRLLAHHGRLSVLPEISTYFAELKSRAEGVRAARVFSAFPLEAAQLQALMPPLERRFGGKLQPSVTVDPALIGGVRVQVGDQVFDASVRGKLDTMAQSLVV